MCESNSLTVGQLIAALQELPANTYVRSLDADGAPTGWVRNVTVDNSLPWRKIVNLGPDAPEDDEKYDRLFAPVREVKSTIKVGEKVYAQVAA